MLSNCTHTQLYTTLSLAIPPGTDEVHTGTHTAMYCTALGLAIPPGTNQQQALPVTTATYAVQLYTHRHSHILHSAWPSLPGQMKYTHRHTQICTTLSLAIPPETYQQQALPVATAAYAVQLYTYTAIYSTQPGHPYRHKSTAGSARDHSSVCCPTVHIHSYILHSAWPSLRG